MERTTTELTRVLRAGALEWLRHLQAARWVLGILAVQAALLCLLALQALLALELLAALLLFGSAALVLALRRGFDLQRRWARNGLVGLAVLDVGWALLGTAPWRVAVPALWLALLLHPDAREWVRPGP